MLNQGVRSLIAYDYYDKRFHFCQPEGGPEPRPESLGSILFGDRIFTSAFQVRGGTRMGEIKHNQLNICCVRI